MVVLCTQGLGDPLVRNLMLEYIIRLQRDVQGREVLLFTEEPPGAQVGQDMIEVLLKAGITWCPLRYDVQGSQWIQKFRLAWTVVKRTRSFVHGHPGTWLIGYLSFGGSYAALLAKLGLGRNMTVCFEPHSRYMVEMGIWSDGGLRHRIVRALEHLQMRTAQALILPTRAGMEQAVSAGAKGELVLQGITIDVDAAAFDATARATYRAQHALGDATVIAYVGKLGGIYYSVDAYLSFAERLLKVRPTMRFLVIASVDQLDELKQHERFTEVAHAFVLQAPVPPERLHEVLSAADLGVIAVPPTPAQAFRTPVKTAHYWAAGLPIVIPSGVSDDPVIAAEEQVGIVVKGLPDVDLDGFLVELDRYMASDRESVRLRCMTAARKHRDTKNMVAHLQRLLA
ncbi:MAG: hypothetical protein R2818_11380 [Flavobacteriales bacterium]